MNYLGKNDKHEFRENLIFFNVTINEKPTINKMNNENKIE